MPAGQFAAKLTAAFDGVWAEQTSLATNEPGADLVPFSWIAVSPANELFLFARYHHTQVLGAGPTPSITAQMPGTFIDITDVYVSRWSATP